MRRSKGRASSDDKISSQLIKKRGVHAIFFITLWKQMSNNYASYFYRINFDVIPSSIELPWLFAQVLRK